MITLEETVIEFNTAKLAKEKGLYLETNKAYNLEGELGCWYDVVGESPFDWNEDVDYDSLRYPAYTQGQLQKYLRELYKIDIYILGYGFGYYPQLNNVPPANQGEIKYVDRRWNMPPEEKNSNYRTYEEALEAGLVEALKQI